MMNKHTECSPRAGRQPERIQNWEPFEDKPDHFIQNTMTNLGSTESKYTKRAGRTNQGEADNKNVRKHAKVRE